MTFPLSNQWTDLEALNAAKLYARIDQRFNSLYALAAAGCLGSTVAGANVTLSTASSFATSAAVTFALTSQRRVRVVATSTFQMASGTAGHYYWRAGYNSGSSAVLGSFIGIGPLVNTTLTVAGSAGAQSADAEGDQLLTAGTYTAYAIAQRISGGTATDFVGGFYLAVYDVGAI